MTAWPGTSTRSKTGVQRRPLTARVLIAVAQVVKAANGRVTDHCGGIMLGCGRGLQTLILGASLIQIYTGMRFIEAQASSAELVRGLARPPLT